VSGGSYNYLYAAVDLEDLQAQRHNLEGMAQRLAGLGYAQDAARETEELLVLLRQWEIRAAVRLKRLADVWHAVEWRDSCDWGDDTMREAFAEWLEKTDPANA